VQGCIQTLATLESSLCMSFIKYCSINNANKLILSISYLKKLTALNKLFKWWLVSKTSRYL